MDAAAAWRAPQRGSPAGSGQQWAAGSGRRGAAGSAARRAGAAPLPRYTMLGLGAAATRRPAAEATGALEQSLSRCRRGFEGRLDGGKVARVRRCSARSARPPCSPAAPGISSSGDGPAGAEENSKRNRALRHGRPNPAPTLLEIQLPPAYAFHEDLTKVPTARFFPLGRPCNIQSRRWPGAFLASCGRRCCSAAPRSGPRRRARRASQ